MIQRNLSDCLWWDMSKLSKTKLSIVVRNGDVLLEMKVKSNGCVVVTKGTKLRCSFENRKRRYLQECLWIFSCGFSPVASKLSILFLLVNHSSFHGNGTLLRKS